MRTAIAAATMTLATACMGASRRDWACAMQGEFETAVAEGGQLRFALGCLLAAVKELPRHAKGRLALADHTLAVAILVPIAAIQFLCAIGMVAPFFPAGGLCSFPVEGSVKAMFFSEACLSTQPARLCLWALLGITNLRLAWLLLEGDWPGVIRAASLAVAVTLTNVVFDFVMMLVDVRSLIQAAVLLIELAAVAASARLHADLLPDTTSDSVNLSL